MYVTSPNGNKKLFKKTGVYDKEEDTQPRSDRLLMIDIPQKSIGLSIQFILNIIYAKVCEDVWIFSCLYII